MGFGVPSFPTTLLCSVMQSLTEFWPRERERETRGIRSSMELLTNARAPHDQSGRAFCWRVQALSSPGAPLFDSASAANNVMPRHTFAPILSLGKFGALLLEKKNNLRNGTVFLATSKVKNSFALTREVCSSFDYSAVVFSLSHFNP